MGVKNRALRAQKKSVFFCLRVWGGQGTWDETAVPAPTDRLRSCWSKYGVPQSNLLVCEQPRRAAPPFVEVLRLFLLPGDRLFDAPVYQPATILRIATVGTAILDRSEAT